MTNKTQGNLIFYLDIFVLSVGANAMRGHGLTEAETIVLVLWAVGFGVLLIMADRQFNKARQEKGKNYDTQDKG